MAPPWCCVSASALLLISGFVYMPTLSWATLYECTDASGARVFTDSPTQLQKCAPLKGSSSAEPSSLSKAAVPTPDTEEVPQPRPAPRAERPPRAPRQPVDSRRQTQEKGAPMSAASQSASVPANESPAAQTCANPLNPLNPLLTIPCGQPESSK